MKLVNDKQYESNQEMCLLWPDQSQAESQKKKLDTIHEYLLYIMSPFVYEEDMDEFCTDLLRFAMDHNYRPEVEWKRYKTKQSSLDVRHLVWSIATRLGLGKGKVYSNDDCACYIERRFASLCVTASGEPLSHMAGHKYRSRYQRIISSV